MPVSNISLGHISYPGIPIPSKDQIAPDILGALSKGVNIRDAIIQSQINKLKSQYAPQMAELELQKAQSSIEQQQAQAAKARIISALLEKFQQQQGGLQNNFSSQGNLLGGTNNNMSQPSTSMGQGSQSPSSQPNTGMGAMAPSAGGSSASGFPLAAFAQSQLGMGQPHLIEPKGTGMTLGVTPFGNFPIAQGLNASQEAYQKGMGKFSAEQYGKQVESYSSLSNQQVALDEMVKSLDNPEFFNVTGPVQSFITKWGGTPQGQQLLGNLQTASGEIALTIAPSLKGAFTGRDQTLINTIKANPNTDNPYVFIGKLKAQSLINKVLQDRSQLAASYIDKGLKPLDAQKKAAKETPLEPYRAQIDRLIEPKISIVNKKTGERKTVTLKEAKKMGIRGL